MNSVFDILGSFLTLRIKLIIGLILVVITTLAILGIYLRGRWDGQAALENKIQHKVEKVEREFKKIDDAPLGVDDAFSRLRKRAPDSGSPNPEGTP